MDYRTEFWNCRIDSRIVELNFGIAIKEFRISELNFGITKIDFRISDLNFGIAKKRF